MLFECWLQLRSEAPEDCRITTADRGLALTHNLGGYPGEMVGFVGIWGTTLDSTTLDSTTLDQTTLDQTTLDQ